MVDARDETLDERDELGSPRQGFLGILMLQTRFVRLPRDIGHPDAFGVPTRRVVVQGAVPRRVVQSAAGLRASGLPAAFVSAARALVADGAWAITTSCGFLVLLQADLQSAVPVPVVSSSLLQLPGLLARAPRVGVLTIDATSLSGDHLLAAGVPAHRLADVLVQGLDADGPFARRILGDRPDIQMKGSDVDAERRDVVAAAQRLRERAPDLRDGVLECTNLPPHQAAIEAATGWRCWSLLDDPLWAAGLTSSSAGAAR